MYMHVGEACSNRIGIVDMQVGKHNINITCRDISGLNVNQVNNHVPQHGLSSPKTRQRQ